MTCYRPLLHCYTLCTVRFVVPCTSPTATFYGTFAGRYMSQVTKRWPWERFVRSCAERVSSSYSILFSPLHPHRPSSLPPPPLLHPSSSIPSSCPPSRPPFVTDLVCPFLLRVSILLTRCFRCLFCLSSPPAASPAGSMSGSPSPHDTLTLRALVSTKEAGIIIGKGGKNVADLREQTGVKAGVSKVIQGVHERVLTVTGPVEGVSKVCNQFLVSQKLQLSTCISFFK